MKTKSPVCTSIYAGQLTFQVWSTNIYSILLHKVVNKFSSYLIKIVLLLQSPVFVCWYYFAAFQIYSFPCFVLNSENGIFQTFQNPLKKPMLWIPGFGIWEGYCQELQLCVAFQANFKGAPHMHIIFGTLLRFSILPIWYCHELSLQNCKRHGVWFGLVWFWRFQRIKNSSSVSTWLNLIQKPNCFDQFGLFGWATDLGSYESLS